MLLGDPDREHTQISRGAHHMGFILKKRWGLYFIKAPLHWIEMSLLGLGWKQLILISVATDRGIDPACSRLVG